ncbi:hypothetical protein LINPERPRIM_LOCUS38524 [Linum perenne]
MEAGLPSLPTKLPVPMYYATPLDIIIKFGCNMRSSGNIGAGKKGFRRSAGTTARKPMVGRGRPLKLDEEIDGIRGRWV